MAIDLKLYHIVRGPSLRGTSIPMYNYVFASTEEEAINKVRLKWGEYDSDIKIKELNQDEIEKLVIATDYYG